MDALKSKITGYWSRRAPSFAGQRLRELSSEKRALWKAEFNRYLPPSRELDILDIGTGSGFFTFLLAEEGHRVVGIDLTEEMIREAEKSAKALHVNAEFAVMDAERPDFPPESFDALVTRNLTWTLPNLEDAYRAWYKLLKPQGVLINFDADYCRQVAEAVEMELPENHAHKNLAPDMIAENDTITMELSAYQEARPQWDVGLLLSAGFERIVTDVGVWGRVYQKKDEFYNPVPIFTIAAYKSERR